MVCVEYTLCMFSKYCMLSIRGVGLVYVVYVQRSVHGICLIYVVYV